MLNLYLPWIRLAAVIVAALVIAFGVVTVQKWHRDSQQLESVRQEMADLKAAQAASQAASRGLQDELQKLRAARKPSPVVRLCKPAKSVPGARAGRDGAAAGTGQLSPTSGRDIGADLYALADDADEVAARLRACQQLLR